MYEDIKTFVDTCTIYQERKNRPNEKRPLDRFPIPHEPFEIISIDLKGPLTLTESGNQLILVVICWFSKYVEAISIPNKQGIIVANALVKGIFCRHGIPKQVLSDQGKEFINNILSEVYKLLGINQLKICTYHPSLNGTVERFNRTLGDLIAMFVNDNQSN